MGRLIGICGAAGAGKDTAAHALIAAGWKREAFADRMRQAMIALDPIVEDQDGYGHARLSYVVGQLGWDDAKRSYPEIRRLLQKFGTEAGRDIHGTDCWVDLVLKPWVRSAEQRDLAITDVRFQNEALAIHEANGIVIKIARRGQELISGGHSSEAGLPDGLVHHVVQNDGSIEDLHAEVLQVVELFWLPK